MNKKNSNISSDKLLQFLQESGAINIDDVLDKMNKMKVDKILQQHEETYHIWQGTNERWYTYLPNEKKERGRQLVAKSSREKLVKEIVDYYKAIEQALVLSRITLGKLYPEWLAFKSMHTASSRTMRIIDGFWNKYYRNTAIVDKPIKELSTLQLDQWAHQLIKAFNLTKKQYYNMAVIMRQSLDFAVEKEVIPSNPFSVIQINAKLFRVVKKKASETQVFSTNEQPQIEEEAFHDFNATGNTACLGISLCFQLGLRLGELVALKWSDIEDEKRNCIHIQRMESKEEQQNEQGTWLPSKRIVLEHTKSCAGDRNVFLTSEAKKLLDFIRLKNQEHGHSESEYIFINKQGTRIHEPALDTRLRKYCRYIGISEKSMHKIRKTYVSTLIDSSININFIREQVGHEDERTTYHSYCYNRKEESLTQLDMEKALCR